MELNKNLVGMDRRWFRRILNTILRLGAAALLVTCSVAVTATQASATAFPSGSSAIELPGQQHDSPRELPSIPLRNGLLCETGLRGSELHPGPAFPVWQGNYTNLAAVGAGSTNGGWIENLLFILSIGLLGGGLIILSRRPENRRHRPQTVGWQIRFTDRD